MFVTLVQLRSKVPAAHREDVTKIEKWLKDKNANITEAFPVLVVMGALGSFEFNWVVNNVKLDFEHKDMPRLIEALKSAGNGAAEKLPAASASKSTKEAAVKAVDSALGTEGRNAFLTAFYNPAKPAVDKPAAGAATDAKAPDDKPTETPAPAGVATDAKAPDDKPADKPVEAPAPEASDNFDFAAFGRAVLSGIATASGKTEAEVKAFLALANKA